MNINFKKIDELLKNQPKIAVAFSGGVDSTVLLHYIISIKGAENVIALTAHTVLLTTEEIAQTAEIAKEFGVEHILLPVDVLKIEQLRNNHKDRCYHCKKFIFNTIIDNINKEYYIVEGTNFDDLDAYRPGYSALQELEIISPFAICKITKKEIREYAEINNLSVAQKPSTPCFATRFEYNSHISEKEIIRAQKGEELLKKYGQSRLRIHGKIARIEIDQQYFSQIIHDFELIKSLRDLGYLYVTLDLEGFLSGSMDKNI